MIKKTSSNQSCGSSGPALLAMLSTFLVKVIILNILYESGHLSLRQWVLNP